MATNCRPIAPLCLPKSGDWSHDFIWQSDGVPVTMTGYSARLQFIDAADASVIADLSTTNGKLVITPAEGKTTATLLFSELRAITEDSAIYELILKSPGGTRISLIAGPVDFEAAIAADVDA